MGISQNTILDSVSLELELSYKMESKSEAGALVKLVFGGMLGSGWQRNLVNRSEFAHSLENY